MAAAGGAASTAMCVGDCSWMLGHSLLFLVPALRTQSLVWQTREKERERECVVREPCEQLVS
jgi:hypothetical protein